MPKAASDLEAVPHPWLPMIDRQLKGGMRGFLRSERKQGVQMAVGRTGAAREKLNREEFTSESGCSMTNAVDAMAMSHAAC